MLTNGFWRVSSNAHMAIKNRWWKFSMILCFFFVCLTKLFHTQTRNKIHTPQTEIQWTNSILMCFKFNRKFHALLEKFRFSMCLCYMQCYHFNTFSFTIISNKNKKMCLQEIWWQAISSLYSYTVFGSHWILNSPCLLIMSEMSRSIVLTTHRRNNTYNNKNHTHLKGRLTVVGWIVNEDERFRLVLGSRQYIEW